MVFSISIKHERKTIRVQVEKIAQSETTEKYKVIAKNQSFVLQNNRPIIIALILFSVKLKQESKVNLYTNVMKKV